MRTAACLAVLFLSATGCHGHSGPGPADAFVHFVAAVGRGQRRAAWKMLATDTREAAERLGAKQSPPVSGQALLLGGQMAIVHGLAGVSVATETGDGAVLEVTADDGSKRKVRMRREDGAWKVVLPIPGGS